MRPVLKAGLLAVWRDRDTLQIGVDPRRAVALAGLGPAAAVISLLDGSRDREGLIAAAQAGGVRPRQAEHVLGLLAVAGLLDDFPANLRRELPGEVWARLAPDLAAASIAYGDGDGGARTLVRRRDAGVHVLGAGRVGASVAAFLAASGVGHVVVTDPAPARPADLTPAGLTRADLGLPRADGAALAVGRVAPEARTADDGTIPDLVILAADGPGAGSPDLIATLTRDGVAHLAVRAGEAIGVVGPLVLPGTSACLRCVDLVKAAGDPAWPKILAQATCARADPPACDVTLAAMTAALTAAQALAFIDRDAAVHPPVTVNGTLEVVLPDWQWRRRGWQPQPGCSCRAAARRARAAEQWIVRSGNERVPGTARHARD